jgi:hypothetical protein
MKKQLTAKELIERSISIGGGESESHEFRTAVTMGILSDLVDMDAEELRKVTQYMLYNKKA